MCPLSVSYPFRLNRDLSQNFHHWVSDVSSSAPLSSEEEIFLFPSNLMCFTLIFLPSLILTLSWASLAELTNWSTLISARGYPSSIYIFWILYSISFSVCGVITCPGVNGIFSSRSLLSNYSLPTNFILSSLGSAETFITR